MSAARYATLLIAIAVAACATQVRYEALEVAPPAPSGITGSVFLVGDAGIRSPGRDSVLAHLERDLDRHEQASPAASRVVLFLGDNIYDLGAREAFREEDLAKLIPQLDAARGASDTRAFFLPGNHDWAKGAGNTPARETIQRQQAWLHELAPDSSALLLPADGCPGPNRVPVAPGVSVILIDTEWLLRRPDDDCGGEDRFYGDLTSLLRSHADERMILAAHHPMSTGGPHGGNVSGLDRGPFIQYLAIKAGLSIQDLASPRYSAMLTRLREAIRASGVRPLGFAAGHDHSLQVIGMEEDGEPLWQLVSGSASKSNKAERIQGTRYATDQHGYMRVDFTATTSRLTVFAQSAADTPLRVVFACELPQESASATACAEAPLAASR
ncbi:MAG: metallophosphoesterase [Longimicrobiales bacterium]